MAIIILRPSETFEHRHSTDSITTLMQGELVYHCNNEKIKLILGEPIDTPANQPHMMENIGQIEAVFGCEHKP